MPRPCSVPGCTRPAVAQTWCATHYRRACRQRERGEPVHLDPIRKRGGPPLVPVSTRVTAATARALGPSPGARLREIAEEWARKRPTQP